MAHPEQKAFCERVKALHPSFFKNKRVLDVGSLDINGNNRFLFEESQHIGIDIGPGPNVDIVAIAHEFADPDGSYDVIISTECFEHDMHYAKSIQNIVRMLAPGGMFLFTCATTDRPEHGTRRSDSGVNAPLLASQGEDWSDYYKNLTEQDIRDVIDVDRVFTAYAFEVEPTAHDLYFWGIKA
jgi:SAM-dependent methyltransferase